jgi:hypothetical protein
MIANPYLHSVILDLYAGCRRYRGIFLAATHPPANQVRVEVLDNAGKMIQNDAQILRLSSQGTTSSDRGPQGANRKTACSVVAQLTALSIPCGFAEGLSIGLQLAVAPVEKQRLIDQHPDCILSCDWPVSDLVSACWLSERSLRTRKKFRTTISGGDECGRIKSLTNILKRRNRFPHIVTGTAKKALNPLDWVSRSQKRNRARRTQRP